MSAIDVAQWMLGQLQRDGCVYQEDVVDHALKLRSESLLRENSDGNLVVGRAILDSFRRITENTVVWVKPDRYWRWRVSEDEPGREARG
jgi:hypothetical protein